MVKHTQTIRRQQPTNCLSVFGDFVKLALKGLIMAVITQIFNPTAELVIATEYQQQK